MSIFSTYDAGLDPGFTAVETITGNTGGAQTPSGGNFNIVTANTTVKFVGTAATLTQDFGLTNLLVGTPGTAASGSSNVSLGLDALDILSTGSFNSCIGKDSAKLLTTGSNNTFIGALVGNRATTGSYNTVLGSQSFTNYTASGSSPDGNVVVGGSAATSLSTGRYNCILGHASGNTISGADSSNILILNPGVSGQSNAVKIGTQGSGLGQQNKCYIAGITGVTTTSSKLVTINSSTTEMGVGIDYNGVASNLNLGTLMSSRTSGDNNVSVGRTALSSVTSGLRNVSLGNGSGIGNSTGSDNVCVGHNAMFLSTSPEQNVAIGNSSLFSLTTGENNIGIGYIAGSALTSSESSNILIGNVGVAAESNAIRIGTAGSGAAQQNRCYIAGISGVTVTGSAVLCATDGLLGTVVSSKRFKENIKPMKDASDRIYQLEPVLFKYKDCEDCSEQRGLIAEEVEKIMPELVVYDDNAKPFSVKYHELPCLLLNEMKKLKEQIDKLYAIIMD